ncbi:dihydrofolate reductase family protein [Pseudomonas sp. GOM6]|uniref:dihydrofolate reductase family protein n=1 Tax=Pseudomonas sp. GOM6 TaxID=3036944 RepID=UPI00240A6F41|nr:dihydrofolate reductase family protein [Pseudomonas sp. GOM6]MDG1582763.1 dihydrofolate reductase family protein [Pseudomonas sp. GOM6]
MKPTLIYCVAASLDGYIARPDGSCDWLAGDDEAIACDGLLLGRATYDALSAHWSLPKKPTLLLTRHRPTHPPEQVRARHCTPSEALDELAALGCRRVRLLGGSSLAGNCSAAGLLDELVVRLMPHLLGAGVPLFAGGMERQLQLIDAYNLNGGSIHLHYRVLPEPQYVTE